MLNIPPCYYTSGVLLLIRDQIAQGKVNWNNIDASMREAIIDALICDLGQDALDAPYDVDQVAYHLKKYIQTGRKEHALDMAITYAQVLREWYEPYIEQIFDEESAASYHADMQARGLTKVIDKINGEVRYR